MKLIQVVQDDNQEALYETSKNTEDAEGLIVQAWRDYDDDDQRDEYLETQEIVRTYTTEIYV